jgi:prepilin-type N-terminal cleavage/methylation domain-containing protein
MSNTSQVTSDRKDTATREAHSGHASRVTRHPPAFTLIEMMIVVAIVGLIAAMGMPSILQALRKDGIRKAVNDVQQALGDARSRAIFSGKTTEVVFHPLEKSIGSTALPDGVDIAMLDVNLLDFGASDEARVRFFPNGTCDELTLVLHFHDEWEKITLEFSTALASVSPVTR